jgi:hypothetical protein
MQSIKVQVRSVYGKPTIYPACRNAQLFADLAKTKTLSHGDLCKIEALGFQVVQVNDVALATIA